MASGSSKQKIVQSIKDATNILVTVSANPSVDELTAALGLTIFLNKLDKHATAVFSGDVPPAITFLKPDETFEQTADSLRDFIIALDKEKADHLRYKVVDDAVKIFITPYRTTISEKDLDFSQGDYNVELVLALNVENSEHIDAALTAHGKILHDATVATITAGDTKSGLGSVDWHENNASGVSELVASLIDDLKTPKIAMDEQISTALLTGLVAATDRFSNNLTSSGVMSIAAELMAAGANQQLVVAKISESIKEDVSKEIASTEDDKSIDKAEQNKSADADSKPEDDKETNKSDDDSLGSLSITHQKSGDLDAVARQTAKESQEDSVRFAEEKLANLTAEKEPEEEIKSAPQAMSDDQPMFAGTLNATTEQAEQDKRREIEKDRNKTVLSHGQRTYSKSDETSSFGNNPLNAAMAPSDEPAKVDPFAAAPNDNQASQSNIPTLEALKEDSELAALAAVDAALSAPSPIASMPTIQPLSETSVTTPAVEPPASSTTQTLTDLEQGTTHAPITPELPPLPPMPDFSTLPPLPPMPTGVDLGSMPSINAPTEGIQTATPAPQESTNFDPARFRIPGQ